MSVIVASAHRQLEASSAIDHTRFRRAAAAPAGKPPALGFGSLFRAVSFTDSRSDNIVGFTACATREVCSGFRPWRYETGLESLRQLTPTTTNVVNRRRTRTTGPCS